MFFFFVFQWQCTVMVNPVQSLAINIPHKEICVTLYNWNWRYTKNVALCIFNNFHSIKITAIVYIRKFWQSTLSYWQHLLEQSALTVDNIVYTLFHNQKAVGLSFKVRIFFFFFVPQHWWNKTAAHTFVVNKSKCPEWIIST